MDEKGCIPLEWPSKRIPQGGIFHNHRVAYTPETQELMKVLMEESKLTLLRRKQLDWCLRTGSSLSEIKREEPRGRSAASSAQIVRPRTSRRRSYSAIIGSGDFERESYRPNQRNEDREIVKLRLQEIMEFGRNLDGRGCNNTISKSTQKPSSKNKQLPSKTDIMHDLISQIKERTEWLEEMELLGEGVKHRNAIRHQIAERFRKLENLKLSNEEFEAIATVLTPDFDSDKLNSNRFNDVEEGSKRINSKDKTSSTNNVENFSRTDFTDNGGSQRQAAAVGETATSELSEPIDEIFLRTLSTDCSPKSSYSERSRNADKLSKLTKKDNTPVSKVPKPNKIKDKLEQKVENIAEISLTCSSCLTTERSQRSKKSVK